MFTCKKCGSTNLDVILSGPHKKLKCLECGTFQKFLGKTEYEAFKLQKELGEKKVQAQPQPSLKEMHETASKIQDKVSDMLQIIVQRTHPDLDPTNLFCPFHWKCENSPCGYCVYDDYEDTMWDNCLYCGLPYGRK